MKTKLVINTGNYFPWTIKFGGALLLIIGTVAAVQNIILVSLFILSGGILLTTRYQLEIDFTNKRFKDYVFVMGLKFGPRKSFTAIEYLFIKSGNVSRTYNSKIHSTTITDVEYDGYIKFSEKDKIHLCSSKNRKTVINKLRKLSDHLDIRIFDYTKSVPDLI